MRAESAWMHTGAIASFGYFLSEVREACWITGSQVITNLLLHARRKHLQYILEYWDGGGMNSTLMWMSEERDKNQTNERKQPYITWVNMDELQPLLSIANG